MRFVAKIPDGDVNISQNSPLKDLVHLGGGLLLVLLLAYFILGGLVDYCANWVSPSLESRIFSRLNLPFSLEPESADSKYVQRIVDELVLSLPDRERYPDSWFQVKIIADPTENAVSAPGGKIFIFRGLLDAASSENDVAMVLGHEIGHIVNRDPLRGLGRGIYLAFVGALIGSDSFGSEFFSVSLSATNLRHSRGQELDADSLGLDLLLQKYGHGSGAADFFRRAADKTGRIEKLVANFSSSHPDPGYRAERIGLILEERGVAPKGTTPLGIKQKSKEKP